jgi:hypothetical protein
VKKTLGKIKKAESEGSVKPKPERRSNEHRWCTLSYLLRRISRGLTEEVNSTCCAGQAQPMLGNARAVISGSRRTAHPLLTPRGHGMFFSDMDIIHSGSLVASQNSTLGLEKISWAADPSAGCVRAVVSRGAYLFF